MLLREAVRILPGLTRPELHDLFCSLGFRTGAEIGVQAGEHATQILTRWPGRLILVDCWMHYAHGVYVDLANVTQPEHERFYGACVKAMKPFGDRTQIMRMFSHEAAALIDDGSLDFVYIDANHRYEWVRRDLESWYPKVRAGGIMAGHDYCTDNRENPKAGTFGVKPAVDEFAAGRTDALYVSTERLWPTWHFFK